MDTTSMLKLLNLLLSPYRSIKFILIYNFFPRSFVLYDQYIINICILVDQC